MSELVTAIVTTKTEKTFALKAVESVLNQTYPHIECIVVDDASDDGTEQALQPYIEHHKINYIYIPPEESAGGNHARNIGIQRAKGKYIAFLDDDDEWLPEKIAKQVKCIDQEHQFVYCGRIHEKNEDATTRKGENITDAKYPEGDCSKIILIQSLSTSSAIMTTRQMLFEVGLFDENLKYWQDYELCIRLLQRTKAKLIRENLVLYRVIDGDKKRLSNQLEGWEQAVNQIYQKHMNLYARLSPRELGDRKYYYCMDGFQRAKKQHRKSKMIYYLLAMLTDINVWAILMQKITNKLKISSHIGQE